MPRWSNGCTGPTGRCRSATRSTPARPCRPALRRERLRNGCKGALERARADGGHGHRRRTGSPRRAGGRVYVPPGGRGIADQTGGSCPRETFAPILYVLKYREIRPGPGAAQRRAAGALLGDLHHRPARERTVSCPPAGSDAGTSPMSISGPRRGGRVGGVGPFWRREGDRRRPRKTAPYGLEGLICRRQTQTVNYGRERRWPEG